MPDIFPLVNSLRTASCACACAFFAGVAAARYVSRLPRAAKGALDVAFTLPLVLPPTVVGYFLLRVLGPRRLVGAWLLETFGARITMSWVGAAVASAVVAFPLIYRTARGAFEQFDPAIEHAARTLGLSESFIFWRIKMPCCRQGLIAGAILAFARALGEYGATSMIAGYTPGVTATISTTVYQMWRTGDDAGAASWALVNVAVSSAVLIAANMLERRDRPR